MARDEDRFYSPCINAKEYLMRIFTAEKVSNVLHVLLLTMIGLASMDVAAHIARHLV